MTSNPNQWLALTREEAIEPDLPICDPHHHLWVRSDDLFPHKIYLLDELLEDTGSGHNVVQTVFVECGSMYRKDGPVELRPVGETEFVEAVATESERNRNDGGGAIIAGTVSHADLTLGEGVKPILEAHLAASPTRFRGIRHNAYWNTSDELSKFNSIRPGLLLDEAFRAGFSSLQHYGLSFETALWHYQLPDLIDLARAFPETTIIVDHIGGLLGIGPYAQDRSGAVKNWQHDIAKLAACPNVMMKLGGLGMPWYGFDWHQRSAPPDSVTLAEGMRPLFLWCIEQFGVDRCMFESNFPVDKVSYSYSLMWNAFKRVVQDFSPTEKVALFHDTAARVYRLATG